MSPFDSYADMNKLFIKTEKFYLPYTMQGIDIGRFVHIRIRWVWLIGYVMNVSCR